jgi:hypothetical protein
MMGETKGLGSKSGLMNHKDNIIIIIESFIHALILFTILTVIFITVISGIQETAFKNEINHILDDNLPKALKTADDMGKLKNILQSIPLDTLANLYSKSNSNTNNTHIRTMMWFCIGVGVVWLIVSSLLLYYSCGKRVPLMFLILQNLIVFSFIGLFELYFFKEIGMKYAPVKPSFIVNRIYMKVNSF